MFNHACFSKVMSHPAREPLTKTIGVLTCTYRRPDSLLRELAALARQQRGPDAVTLVVRHDDQATLDAIASGVPSGLPVQVVMVNRSGTVHALNAGLLACRTDVLAITDDDTEPRPDWLARILAHFANDPTVGAVGGRDWIHEGGRIDDRSETTTGRFQWFGRLIGNHHLGVGPAREVDFLKGANMSYRSEAIADIRFDTRLRGAGAQPFEDIAFSTDVRMAGWRVIYDPAVAVDHHPGQRDQPRAYAGALESNDQQLFDFSFNEVVALWRAMHWPRRLCFVIWSLLIGTRVSPGLVQAIRFTPQLRHRAWERFAAVQRGKAVAIWHMLRTARSVAGP